LSYLKYLVKTQLNVINAKNETTKYIQPKSHYFYYFSSMFRGFVPLWDGI